MSLIAHAERELGPMPVEEGPDKWTYENVLELLRVFSAQGHSGFSASHCIGLFRKLANYEPIRPLTGESDEWQEVGPGVFQNLRYSHVFKRADRFDGQAYDISGRVFRCSDGVCYTSKDSSVPIIFPYTPVTEYVDVEDDK